MRPRPRQPLPPRQAQRPRQATPTRRESVPPWEAAEVAAWRRHQEAPRRRRRARPKPPSRLGSFARALTGALAGGLLLLALGLVGAQVWAVLNGYEGPGAGSVAWHVVAALAAVVLQTVADRRRDRIGNLCALSVFAVVIATIWVWWWT